MRRSPEIVTVLVLPCVYRSNSCVRRLSRANESTGEASVQLEFSLTRSSLNTLLCLRVPLKKIRLYIFHRDSFAANQMESKCEACGSRGARRAVE